MTAPIFHREHKTIGELAALLEACPKASRGGVERRVAFDFCGFAPNGIHARSPGHLALGHSAMIREQWPTVARLLKALYGAVHQTFHGPGIEFVATADTPLWVGNGWAGDGFTVVAGVQDGGDLAPNVYLRTEHWEVVS